MHLTQPRNADMFESVIIHLEATKDTRQNTGEMLKRLTTQNRHRANEKNTPQRQVYKYFAIVITSNYPVPIVIDKGDRRHFVPAFSKHLYDDGEGMAGKHENKRAWRKKGWSVWQSHGLHTDLGRLTGC